MENNGARPPDGRAPGLASHLARGFGLWPGLAYGGGGAVVLGTATLVLTAILGTVWLSRARAARRFDAVLDAYAEREIDRERRSHRPGGSPLR